MARLSDRERRDARRERASKEQALAKDAAERARLREAIRVRLAEVPASWRKRYEELVVERGLAGKASLERLSLASLRTRHALLPPRTEYVHMTNAKHPSLPEARVTDVRLCERRSPQRNREKCNNKSAFSMRTLTFPERANISRIKPANLLELHVAGRTECVHLGTVVALHRRGYTFAPSYQRDARGDEWAEMRIDTHHHGTVRLPLWLVTRATGRVFAPTSTRLLPPHETRYA